MPKRRSNTISTESNSGTGAIGASGSGMSPGVINGVASGKCGFTTLRAFSPLILRVCGLFRYSKVYVVL